MAFLHYPWASLYSLPMSSDQILNLLSEEGRPVRKAKKEKIKETNLHSSTQHHELFSNLFFNKSQ
jgi:hypothetical protein